MNKQYAYVIQRDDGKYLKKQLSYNTEADIFEYKISWISSVLQAIVDIYHWTDYKNTEESVMSMIKRLELKNCKPVKVEIKVVEDE